ncbi:hypothetical protein KBD59_04000 [Candidatus Gracilibacteria bacterium]|nr:hypothetical protein [Candidatus Gracilibacteria bacterium]
MAEAQLTPSEGRLTSREVEDRKLAASYWRMLTQAGALENQHEGEFTTFEAANFVRQQNKTLRVPSDLHFNALKSVVSPEFCDEIEQCWLIAVDSVRTWHTQKRMLNEKWKKPPAVLDEQIDPALRNVATQIRERFRGVVRTIFARPKRKTGELPDFTNPTESPALELWINDEKNNRKGYQDAYNNMLAAFNNYFEKLLEVPPEGVEKPPAVPLDDPRRGHIILLNRQMKELRAADLGIGQAKGSHHKQPGKRMRNHNEDPKEPPAAYVTHEKEVVETLFTDVLQFSRKEPTLKGFKFVFTILLAALHDVGEDTKITIEYVQDLIENRVQYLDSSIASHARSSYEPHVTQDRFIKKRIHILSDEPYGKGKNAKNVYQLLADALRALSKNSGLTEEEKNVAFKQNLFGRTKTRELLQTEKEPRQGISHDKPTSETGKLFPESYDTEVDCMLVKMNAIARDRLEDKQAIFMVKLLDRSNNMKTCGFIKPEKQRKMLRATVTRLIAYGMMDWNHDAAPLYNTLPRLIDITHREYERFKSEETDGRKNSLWEDADEAILQQLRVWKCLVTRWPDDADVIRHRTQYNVERASYLSAA